MTVWEWVASTRPEEMLRWLQSGSNHCVGSLSDRKLRLLACACCRRHADALSPTGRRFLDTAEALADGQAAQEEVDVASWKQGECFRRACPTWLAPLHFTDPSAMAAAVLGNFLLEGVGHSADRADLLRCLFGNVFRPVPLKWIKGQLSRLLEVDETPERPRRRRGSVVHSTLVREKWHAVSWLSWNDGAVPKLARAIYDQRAFDRLPILADALEEAGCDDPDILAHCRGLVRCYRCGGEGRVEDVAGEDLDGRGGRLVVLDCEYCDRGWRPAGPHARGCHVVDLLLDKE